jgi:hypothetical protein
MKHDTGQLRSRAEGADSRGQMLTRDKQPRRDRRARSRSPARLYATDASLVEQAGSRGLVRLRVLDGAPGPRSRGVPSPVERDGELGSSSQSSPPEVNVQSSTRRRPIKGQAGSRCERCLGSCEGNLRFACGRRVSLCIKCTAVFAKLLQEFDRATRGIPVSWLWF